MTNELIIFIKENSLLISAYKTGFRHELKYDNACAIALLAFNNDG
jgi:hypothetical protein